MNLSASSLSSSSRALDRDVPSPREGTRHHPARDRFERALQSREQRQESRDEGDSAPCDEETPAAWAVAPLPLRAAASGAPLTGATPIIEKSSTCAAIETSLSAAPGQAVTPPAGVEPAALWEVSVTDSLASPLQVRVERTSTTEAQRAWGLTIGSQAANVEMLVRHAPRLNERLRKHGIELDHVRVEHGNDDER